MREPWSNPCWTACSSGSLIPSLFETSWPKTPPYHRFRCLAPWYIAFSASSVSPWKVQIQLWSVISEKHVLVSHSHVKQHTSFSHSGSGFTMSSMTVRADSGSRLMRWASTSNENVRASGLTPSPTRWLYTLVASGVCKSKQAQSL